MRRDDRAGGEQLVEDFHQKDAKEMHFKTLADGVKHFKETEEGRENMCEAVEKYAEERELKTKIDIAKKLIKEAGFSIDQVIKLLDIDKNRQESFVSQIKN